MYTNNVLLKYGLNNNDQKIDFATIPSAVPLDTPIFYYGNIYNDIYIHPNGGISFDGPIEDVDIANEDRTAILVAYGKYGYSDTYFRQIKASDEEIGLLNKVIQTKFVNEESFVANGAIVITWDNAKLSKDAEKSNTFQLILLSNVSNTYALINFDKTEVVKGNDLNSIQFVFMDSQGHRENMAQQDGEMINLSMQSNIESSGKFAFRISTTIEDPRPPLEEEYNYDEDTSLEEGCPENKYGDKCPEHCSFITDSRGCSMCLCSTSKTEEMNNDIKDTYPSEDKLLESELLPLPKDEDEDDIDSNTINNNIPHNNDQIIKHHDSHPINNNHNTENNYVIDNNISPVLEEENELPSIVDPVAYSLDNKGVCSHKQESEVICSNNANCIDYVEGYCCECSDNYYGNGKYCISSNEAVRVTGKFNGVINGKTLEGAELHTFVQAGGGTTYTAVSNLPPTIRNSILLLNPLASIIGWMFARTANDGETYNGFMLTGGVFNRTVNIRIGDRYAVVINQKFSGSNDNGDVDSEIYIRGTLPEFDDNVVITYESFNEEYRRESPGNLRSYGTVEVTIKNGPETGEDKWKIITDQQIKYIECPNKEFTRPKIISIHAQRVSANYNPLEKIARYSSVSMATSGSINSNTGEIVKSVCAPGHHICTGEHMKCLAVENSYRCVCEEGYETVHDTTSTTGFSCKKEARSQVSHNTRIEKGSCTAHSQCHKWGECVFGQNGQPGYCKCRGWYVGDGVDHCGPPERREEKPSNNCGQYNCDANADCMPAPNGVGTECVCKAGFYGNGLRCQSMDLDNINEPKKIEVESKILNDVVCHSHDECGEFGSCSYSSSLGYYKCECQSGYTGDGITCTPSVSNPQSCNVLHNCGTFADCVFTKNTYNNNEYMCKCREGYTGNGYICYKTIIDEVPKTENPLNVIYRPLYHHKPSHRNPRACEIELGCNEMARCVFDAENNRKICECMNGYDGDGINCHPYKPEVVHKQQASEESEEDNLVNNQDIVVHPQNYNFGNEHDTVSRCSDSADCSPDEHCVINDIYGYHTCMCLPGYRRDQNGNCRSADTCLPSEINSCPPNSHCVFSHQTQAYDCQCVQGFKNNGHGCVAYVEEEITCDKDSRVCNVNAQCIYHHDAKKHICLCNPGFSGDGYKECIREETPLCTDCSINGKCVQNPLTNAWSCQCNPGFVGNGKVCQPTKSCLEDRSICHSNAECVPGQYGHYVCNCRYGYHGNGKICIPDSAERRDGDLLIGSGMTIFQRSRDAETLGKQLVVIPRQLIVGIAFDCQTEKIYWTDSSGHTIRHSNINGTDVNILKEDDLRSPEGIAIDWSSRNIYYADSGKKEIGVISMDGKYQKTLLNKGLVHPRGIAIDMINHKLYYSDWNRISPYIGRMNLDGSNNEVFINTDIAVPNGLTFLSIRYEICWVDAGLQQLSCASIQNPKNRRVVYAPLDYPFGLTVFNDERFYWTGWHDNKIHSVSIYGENRETFPVSVINSRGKLYGITTIPKKCEGSGTVCGNENGGCPYLCLPGENNKATCLCPDNIENLEGC
uniref:EGF-like domain-containing protein n=1 Tax=Strongyloides stercoralis TaxID=6248 RepID=A0A913I0X9_STRER